MGEYARRRNDLLVGGTPDRARVGQTLWGGRFEAGFALALRHVLAARGEWHFIESDVLPVPDSELYDFGGAQTLRGYREAQFRGDRVAFGGVEYRYGNPRAARVYAFVDAGTYSRHLDSRLRDKDAMLGYGAGLRAAVVTGTLDLAFGLGDDERSFDAIKLHVFLLSDPKIKLTQLYGLRFAFFERSAVNSASAVISTSAVNSASAVFARPSFRHVSGVGKLSLFNRRTSFDRCPKGRV